MWPLPNFRAIICSSLLLLPWYGATSQFIWKLNKQFRIFCPHSCSTLLGGIVVSVKPLAYIRIQFLSQISVMFGHWFFKYDRIKVFLIEWSFDQAAIVIRKSDWILTKWLFFTQPDQRCKPKLQLTCLAFLTLIYSGHLLCIVLIPSQSFAMGRHLLAV